MKKRGQITIFVIVVIIIALVAFLLLSNQNEPTEIDTPIKVPPKLQPVNSLVENCLKDVTRNGLDELMAHGGYIYTEGLYSDPLNPTESEAVEFVPNSNYLVPYWHYMESDNDCRGGCVFSTKRKPLCKTGRECITEGDNSIELELERYIDENLKTCISGFGQIRAAGLYTTEKSSPQSTVFVRDDTVLVELDYPIEINFEGSIESLDTFRVSIPSELSGLYKNAFEISNYEYTNCFLDEHMLNLISIYSGLGKELPPYSASSNDIADVIWIKNDVKEKLKSISSSFIPLIRLANTTNDPFPALEGPAQLITQGINNQFLFEPFSEFQDLDYSFYYFPWWEPYFDVLPSNGQIIGPSEVVDYSGNFLSDLLGGIITKEYAFGYKYSYPTVVELRTYDVNGNERMFRFALEGNIRANKCFHPDVDIKNQGSITQSLLCDEEFFRNQNHTLKVRDEYTGKELEEVQIYFNSGDTCSLGSTNNEGLLITKYPSAEGGMLKFQKDGYLTKFVLESDLSGTIKLKPLFELPVNFSLFNHSSYVEMLTKTNWKTVRDENLRLANENDTIILSLERVQESYQDPVFVKTIAFSDNKFSPETIEITKGTYNVRINYFLNENITLVEEKDRICMADDIGFTGSCVKTPVNSTCYPRGTTGDETEDWRESDCYVDGYTCEPITVALDRDSGAVSDWNKIKCQTLGMPTLCTELSCAADEEITIPETNVSSIMLGGALLNKTNRYWWVTDYDKINESDYISFYIYQGKIPVRHHELEDALLYEDISMRYPGLFKPEFK